MKSVGILYLFLFLGWVANIVQLFSADFAVWSAPLVLKCAGIIVGPLGIVMGYVGMF